LFKILTKKIMVPSIKLFEIEAPLVARKALPGQFVILRIDEHGERIPLTIFDYDRARGTVFIIFQEVGKSTMQLGAMEEGDLLLDLVGPLGLPMKEERDKKIVCVGGGVGVAPVFLKARSLYENKNYVISIIGARTKNLLILEEEMRQVSHEIYITTDDGSYGRHGFVTEALKEVLEKNRPDLVLAVGPVMMMRACSEVTRPYGVETLVSLNSIMVDGTGMCGCCRVMVDGKVRFTCSDGPVFDGHLVDFKELMSRQNRFLEEERIASERFIQMCRKIERCDN